MGPSRPRLPSRLLLGGLATLLAAACGVRSPEQQVLEEFFRDARLIDSTMLARTATTTFDPRTRGSIQQFEITAMGAERVAGSTVMRDVTLEAPVHTPDGPTVQRTLVATLQRTGDGRWLVTAIR